MNKNKHYQTSPFFVSNLAQHICLLICCCFISGCYSFKGTSIPPTVNTFYIETFDDQTTGSAPTLAQDFTVLLIDKIRSESRLQFTDTDPDIEFKGTVTNFEVTAEAPQPDEQVSFNNLNIEVLVEYIEEGNEDAGWSKRFPFFRPFPADVTLLEVQDQLIQEISEQLVEDIFNKAFTNW